MPLDDCEPASWVGGLADDARLAGEDIGAALQVARRAGRLLPRPGGGSSASRLGALAAMARAGVTVARVVEAHTDALAILGEHDPSVDPGDLTWGVFAAETPDTRLDATPAGGGVELTGRKPWCSLGDVLDAALVTAHTPGGRQLFRVRLQQPGVSVTPARDWVARGLRTVTSVPIDFDHVPAEPVGEPGWYLRRPGFAWGGIGVAACWHGGAEGLADTLRSWARGRDGDLVALHVGVVDAALHRSRAVLAHAARRMDAPTPGDPATGDVALLALRTRAVVADAVEDVLRQVGHALGPGPLAFDAAYAARVADLQLYVRQHHAERDLAALGRLLLDEP